MITSIDPETGNKATFSDDERDRFTLEWWVNREVSVVRRLLFAMLNPSTANAFKLDPTVKRCVKFGRLWGFDIVEIVNLDSFRSPKPKVLRAQLEIERGKTCPRRAHNTQALIDAATRADQIICAWGSCAWMMHRAEQVRVLLENASSRPLFHLGLTKDGSPKHPLARGKSFIPYSQPPIQWGAAS